MNDIEKVKNALVHCVYHVTWCAICSLVNCLGNYVISEVLFLCESLGFLYFVTARY